MRIHLRILNWDQYNEKRTDVKKPGWLRVEKSLPMSQSLFGVPAAERYVFFTFLAFACEKQSAELEFDSGWFLHFYGAEAFDLDCLYSTLRLLHGRTIDVLEGLPEAEPGTEPPRAADVTCQGRERNEAEPGTEPPRAATNETDERNGTERNDPPPHARARETKDDQRGPIPELAEVVGSILLADLRQEGQRAWVDVYGIELVKRELPDAFAKWSSDPVRQAQGGVSKYLADWFKNAKKQGERERAGPGRSDRDDERNPPLRNTRRPCRAALNFPNICDVHGSGDYCTMAGRPPPRETDFEKAGAA